MEEAAGVDVARDAQARDQEEEGELRRSVEMDKQILDVCLCLTVCLLACMLFAFPLSLVKPRLVSWFFSSLVSRLSLDPQAEKEMIFDYVRRSRPYFPGLFSEQVCEKLDKFFKSAPDDQRAEMLDVSDSENNNLDVVIIVIIINSSSSIINLVCLVVYTSIVPRVDRAP